MNATATLEQSIEHDLQHRLRAAGINPDTAQAITTSLPPAGQHHLNTELRDNENALQDLGHTWPGDLQERFRTTFVTADWIRAQLLAVAR